jgi:hypothetical protein
VILEFLASGALSLTCIRMLGRHLTPENHQAVLARASGQKRREIEALVAELAPRPDVASMVRKLPAPAPSRGTSSLPAPVARNEPPALAAVPILPPTPHADRLFSRHSRPCAARGLAARRRPVRLRCPRWTAMHRAQLPGVPSRRAVRGRRAGHRREHLASPPAPQPVRGSARVRRKRSRRAESYGDSPSTRRCAWSCRSSCTRNSARDSGVRLACQSS